MSEQTPNSPENMQDSPVGDDEPSMEDILASIRKIISEDEPIALESPENLSDLSSVTLASDAEIEHQAEFEASDPSELESLPRDVVDVDLDEMLAKIDAATEAQAQAEISALSPKPSAAEFDDEDVLALMDMNISLEDDIPDSLSTDDHHSTATLTAEDPLPGGVDLASVSDKTHDDEIESLLDDILATSDEDDMVMAGQAASVESDPDLDLVKSLMADLSDNIDAEKVQNDEEEDYIADLDALLTIPEVEPEVEASFDDGESEDILGDILNMTLDDEIKNHPEEISAATLAADEMANVDANMVSEQIAEASTADDLPSLSEIAAAAEADAQAIETPVQAPSAVATTAGLVAGAASVAALGGATLGQVQPETTDAAPSEAAQTETSKSEAEEIADALEFAAAEVEAEPTLDLTPEHTEQETIPQEPTMPVKAVNTDTILDDVTESAAAGAFAELNSVVEEKAVFNERGPRIGDLVQEALRPMLKDWLDANLKGIVERAVAKEVKRISTGK